MFDKKRQAQQVFGRHAQNYVRSATHAKGETLYRLLEAINPQAGEVALDVATGGGHVALALSEVGVRVVSSDLTFPMLQAARQHLGEQAAMFIQNDAENLPFPDNHFDLVTCRTAPHHFPNVAGFVAEVARILKPNGRFGLVDIVSPENQKAARYANLFETLRDPSHAWAYSVLDWRRFLEKSGLRVQHVEPVETPQQVGSWAVRVGCDQATTERLRAMVLQAPQPIREWYKITAQPGIMPYQEVNFTIQQAVFVAVKAG